MSERGIASEPSRAAGSAFVGRPRSLPSARRFVTAQRDRALLRLWRSAPEAVGYLAGVVRGQAEFDEGRYKAAVQVLSRCLPTVTAQAIQSDSTVVTANASTQELVEALARKLLEEDHDAR